MKKLVCVVMCIFLVGTNSGCFAKTIYEKSQEAYQGIKYKFYNPYIWQFGEGTWVCEELNLEFQITSYTSEEVESVGTIEKDEEVIDIVFACTFSRMVEIYDKNEYDASIAEYGGIACEPILIIEYDFEDENPVTKAVVTKDTLFGGEWLDKEVTLKKVEDE